MTKNLKLFTAFLFIALLFCLPISANADSGAALFVPEGLEAGNDFTVTVTLNADQPFSTAQAVLAYDETAVEFVSSDWANGGGGIVNISAFTNGTESSVSINLGFKALKTGQTKLILSDGVASGYDGSVIASGITAQNEFSIGGTDVPLDSVTDSSSDSLSSGIDSGADTSGMKAVLKSMKPSVGELRPEFSPGIYDYTITLDHNVDVLDITGETGEETDTIWYEGSRYLADGKTMRTITVTSADGVTKNVYTISVYRLPEENSSLDDSADSDDSQEQSEVQTVTSSSGRFYISQAESVDKSAQMREKILPVLYVAMAVIVVAVAFLAIWLKNKNDEKYK